MNAAAPAYHPIPVEDFRLADCAGKERLDRGQAKEIAARMNWSRRNKVKMNSYQCRHCGSWHVGAKN